MKTIASVILSMAILVTASFAEARIDKIACDASGEVSVTWVFERGSNPSKAFRVLFQKEAGSEKSVEGRIRLPKGMDARKIPVGTGITVVGINGDLNHLLDRGSCCPKGNASALPIEPKEEKEINGKVPDSVWAGLYENYLRESEKANQEILESLKFSRAEANQIRLENLELQKRLKTTQDEAEFFQKKFNSQRRFVIVSASIFLIMFIIIGFLTHQLRREKRKKSKSAGALSNVMRRLNGDLGEGAAKLIELEKRGYEQNESGIIGRTHYS